MRLTDLLGAEIVTTSGAKLGRVLDVRVERHGDRYRVEGLVIRGSGIRARLGLSRSRGPQRLRARDVIPWTAVKNCEGGHVLVDARAQLVG